MAVAILFSGQGLTKDGYDEVWRRLRAAGQESPAGRQLHVSFGTSDNLSVLDIWDSTEAFAAFGETLLPIVAELGIKLQPAISEVNYRLDG